MKSIGFQLISCHCSGIICNHFKLEGKNKILYTMLSIFCPVLVLKYH